MTSTVRCFARGAMLIAFSVLICSAAVCPAADNPADDDFTLDHRYAPPYWQTSICLPDDWQKTLVGKDGSLLYDYRGKFADFKTRITAGVAGPAEWERQELVSPRVPITRTLKRAGGVTIVEEAFAVAPPLPAGPAAEPPPGLGVERVDEGSENLNWAEPAVACDPGFRHIAVMNNGPVRYRFPAEPKAKYTVVFGLCEGWWAEPGKRVLQLQVEGETRQTVDMIRDHGRNVPTVFSQPAEDQNADGIIDLAVAPAPGSPDQNAILNTLWVFAGDAPPAAELVAGRTAAAPLAHVLCGFKPQEGGTPRNDVLLVRLSNPGAAEAAVTPTLTIESEFEIAAEPSERLVRIGPGTVVVAAQPFTVAEKAAEKTTLRLDPVVVPAGGEQLVAFGVVRSQRALLVPADVIQAQDLRRRAESFWQTVDLPYGRISVPDPGVQALVDSSIRNIWQAREIKRGLPAFQVGPTCYRGLWVVDGSFLMEAVAFLGRTDEARAGIEYLLGFQRDDGAIMIMDGHWKETGIALWAVTRHARLTGDREWLAQQWPKLERGWEYIRHMRAATEADPAAPNRGLIPDGFSDGGLGGKYPEYTNVYWTLVGMKAGVDAARWLGKTDEADRWQRDYDDLLAAFRRAAQRDAKTDPSGNRYVPIRMRDPENVAPQRGQWGFLHAVFPGQVFAPDDPLVEGNMAMLRDVECEGLVFGTGWIADGLWNYFGSFYGHALLWRGDGPKAARTLYAFGNHASPLLTWREEQSPTGKGTAICGDMPHNWASAEFIRLVRHLVVLERGDELHLAEGLPPAWVRPGAVTRLDGVMTEFGPIGLELSVAADGSSAILKLDPPRRNPPERIVLHLDGWSGQSGTIELPTDAPSRRTLGLKP